MCQTSLAESLSYKFEKNIFYRANERDKNDADTLIESKCGLDIYFPENQHGSTTVIYLHGGGLTLGDKSEIPSNFYNKRIIVVTPNYRLSPNSRCPAYIEDCAAAIAWTYNNINKYGGDKSKIILSGGSAGAYLATMVFLDKHYLSKYNIDPDSLAGLFSFSGQMTTHFTICNERGLPEGSDTKIIDEFAPLYHIRKTIRPMYFFIGDSVLDMPGRYVQNKLIVQKLKEQGNDKVYFRELKNTDHSTMTNPSMDSASIIIQKIISSIDTNKIRKITLSPNPVRHGYFKIESDDDVINLNIFNDNGRLTKSVSNVSNKTIDVHELKKGFYIVAAKTKTIKFRQKILIL